MGGGDIALMKSISFMKLSGAGNDFIVIDNRQRILTPKALPAFVRHVCKHHLSVGADGLILIEKSRKADFAWRFFNDDGVEASFCGNGARCAARFAFLKKIAPKAMRFDGAAGLVEAEVHGYRVTVKVPNPSAMKLSLRIPIEDKLYEGHAINTGVPHCVYFVPNTVQADVIGVGRATRFHDVFEPAGANVNFVRVVDPHTIHVRTYERGVEAETLACGSGSIAAALIASKVHKVESPVTVIPKSGLPLTVTFKTDGKNFTEVSLTGEARSIYQGTMRSDAWEYELS
jgi:diaminopimelate epimerase